jgi:hypothetical protein
MTWLFAVVMALVAWLTLRRRSVVGMVLVFGFLGFGVAAALLYHPSRIDLQGANIGVASDTGVQYLSPFLLAAFAVWVGTMAVIGISGLAYDPVTPGHKPLSRPKGIELPAKALLFAPIPLFLYVYGAGISTVFHASAYLQQTGPTFAADLAHALGPFGVLICGYFVFDRRQSMSTRTMSLVLALGYELFYLATATRLFAIWPMLMWIGGYLSGLWPLRRQRILLAAAVALSILAVQIPLGLRGLPDHGLIPAFHYLFSQPSLVFGGYDPIRNFLFGAPLTLYVAHDIGRLSTHDLIVSLNPMPSQFTDWSQIAPTLRVNIYYPYSALGELLNHGWLVYFSVVAAFGAGFSAIERLALRGRGMLGGLAQIAVLGIAGLFLLQSTEYNLRTAARLLYYAFAAVFVLVVVLPRLLEGRMGSSRVMRTVHERATPDTDAAWKIEAPRNEGSRVGFHHPDGVATEKLGGVPPSIGG